MDPSVGDFSDVVQLPAGLQPGEADSGLMKTGRNSRISDLGRFFESVALSGRSCRSFDMRKAGKQEQPHEAMTRLGSSVVLAKFSSKPCCLPTAFSCERTTAKWMSSRFLIALRSTTMVSSTKRSSR